MSLLRAYALMKDETAKEKHSIILESNLHVCFFNVVVIHTVLPLGNYCDKNQTSQVSGASYILLPIQRSYLHFDALQPS